MSSTMFVCLSCFKRLLFRLSFGGGLFGSSDTRFTSVLTSGECKLSVFSFDISRCRLLVQDDVSEKDEREEGGEGGVI